jgi:hypothetical protein
MEQEKWRELAERYTTPEELEAWRATAPPEGFDQQAYARQWQDLGARIEAALPLDPASAQAQALLDEWQALLKPFLGVATPAMKTGAERFWQKRGEWEGEVKAPFSAEVSRFIAEAGRVRGG